MNLFSSIASSICTSLLFVWLARTWISERLKGAIKSEYDEKLETFRSKLKSESDVALTRLSADLQVAAAQRNIEYAKLHEIRAQHIAELYKRLSNFYNVGTGFLPGRQANKERQEEFLKSLTSTWTYADEVKIYFTKEHWTLISGFIEGLRALGYEKMIFSEDQPVTHAQILEEQERLMKRWEKIRDDVPKALGVIEDAFRELLGVK